MSVVVYGKDGPVFERACPFCRRYLKLPLDVKWNEDITGLCKFRFEPPVECKRCGPVKPEHIGWAGDFAP
jgi:hypothetical protein